MTQAEPTRPRPKGPALVDVQMHLHTPADPGEGVVVSTERCTERKPAAFVRHLVLDVTGTRLEGNFRPGQSFGVLPPGLDAHGKPHKVRLYSIASPTRGEDGRGRIIATTVKRTIDEHRDTGRLFLGVASNYLCDLKTGDRVRLTGPSGKRFVLPANPAEHDYVFLATGTGIAPFRGMLLDLLEGAEPRAGARGSRIVLVMGAAYATDLLYHAELTALEARHPEFRYLTAISRHAQPDGRPPMYVQDRLTSDPELLVPLLSSDRTLVYICGLAGMELGVFQALSRVLPPPAREPYLELDPAAGDPAAWQRSMIHRQVCPTRRVFLEVY